MTGCSVLPGPWILLAPFRPAGGPQGRGEEPRAGAQAAKGSVGGDAERGRGGFAVEGRLSVGSSASAGGSVLVAMSPLILTLL